MKLLEKFKSHLTSKKNKPSRVTIKNYVSDVRKFIIWYENQSRTSFNAKKITIETINVYKSYLNGKETPSNSVERYLSSLRRFFSFLKQESLTNNNPFDKGFEVKQLANNPLPLDRFKIYLLSENISKITVKNYLVDIRQFLTWIEKRAGRVHDAEIINEVSKVLINEYKDQLLYQEHLSPVSINRKLSSLRKYMTWIEKKDIKKTYSDKTITTTGQHTNYRSNLYKNQEEENNKKIHENVYRSNPSGFRQLRNTIDIFNKLGDFMITLPIVRLLEKSEFLIWKIKGAEVFTPLPQTLDNNLKLKQQAIKSLHNIPKSIHHSLKIPAESLPRHKKIYFHLRYTRPKWYRKYHSYSISHYIHLAVLFIFTSTSGLLVYNSIYGSNPQQKAVFASQPWTRPKILAFQGKLSDANNNAITQPTSIRFAIYNNRSASGSALLWQEVQSVDPDNDGMFKTQIGQQTPISSSLFTANTALYLGLTVGKEKELQPRQELATVSYSTQAQQLQGLIPITKNGAGTSNVILALDSAGNLAIGGKANPTFEASGGQFTLSGKTLLLTSVSGSDGNITISPDGNGIIDLQKPIQNTTNNNTIESIQGAVEIDDLLAIIATSSGQSALTINQNSSGPLISASTSGTAMFTLENNGTGIFAGNLFLKGDSLTSANTSFNLLNTDTINLNIGNAATAISLGANEGSTTINNTLIASSLIVSGSVASDLNPLSTGIYNLGSPANYWNNAYIDNLYTSQTATVSGFWQRNKGAVSPSSPTDDFIVAGTSTESAKFQIFGSGANAGTASTSGQLTFVKSSQINLLNNSNFGFYNSPSGNTGINSANPSLYLASNGNIGIGTSTPTAKLHVNGDIRAQKIYATTTELQQADLAENYISSQNLEPGDVIMPEGKDNNLAVIKTTMPYESKAIGIVSTRPGIILNSEAVADKDHPNIFPIALSGRVPVKVTTENGPIMAGDYLSTSSISGVAMKATKKGNVIGKAMESYANSDPAMVGKILVFANLSYFDSSAATGYPEEYNLPNNMDGISGLIQTLTQVIVSNIQVGFIQAKKTVTDSLYVTTENITIGGQTLKEYITNIIQDTLKQQLAVNNLPSPINPPAALLSPLASGSAITLKFDSSRLSILNSQSASASAVAVLDNQGNASFSGTLTSDTLKANDASISGTLRVRNLIADNIVSATNSANYITNITNIFNTYTATGSAVPPATNSALPSVALTKESLPASGSSPLNIETQSVLSLFEKNPQINNDYANLSSLSGSFTNIPNLNTLSNLQVLGQSTLSDVAVVGQLNVNGSLILSDNSINTLGSDLEIQPLRQGNLSIMGSLITINTDGNLKVGGNAIFTKDLTVKGKIVADIIAPIPNSDLIIQLGTNQKKSDSKSEIPNSEFVIKNASGSAVLAVNQLGNIRASGSGTFSTLAAKAFNIVRGVQADTSLVQTTASSSAGTATITAYEIERTIMSPFATKDSLIYLTAASDTQGLTPYIARQTENDFTIAIPYAINKDIKINWWIIN